MAKVFEPIVYDQLYHYLNESNFLSRHQSRFRSLHSTVTALIEATDNWSLNIDRGFINAVVFLDLKKAFDKVDHTTLLSKLQAYGIQGSINQWFCSYLKNRSQKLQKLQSRAARVITFSNYDRSTDELLRMVNWVKLDRQRLVNKSILMYKIVNNMVPNYLSSYFVFRSDTVRFPSLSPALIIVKEVCPVAELYCEIVRAWIFGSRSLLMNINLSWRTIILIVVLCKFLFYIYTRLPCKAGFLLFLLL